MTDADINTLRASIDRATQGTGTWHWDPSTIEPVSGAYLLCISLRASADIVFKGNVVRIEIGRYVYAGSARGPGGLRARLARHFRPRKSVRWHIDRLTTLAPQIAACTFVDQTECDLVSALRQSGRFEFPLPGFGSSDCRRCPSHLLIWRDETGTGTG